LQRLVRLAAGTGGPPADVRVVLAEPAAEGAVDLGERGVGRDAELGVRIGSS